MSPACAAAAAAAGGRSPGCVYCLGNRSLSPRQILCRGVGAYLAAPLGQMVEGFLGIAPQHCVPSLSQLPRPVLAEVMRLQALARRFLGAVYGADTVLCYEQGRGGDGTCRDPLSGFPLHAHLCLLPVVQPLPHDLAERVCGQLGSLFAVQPLHSLDDLPRVCGAQPYLYLESTRGCLFTGRNDRERRALASARLKPLLASLGGLPGRGDWRACPGLDELDRLIEHWNLPWPTVRALR